MPKRDYVTIDDEDLNVRLDDDPPPVLYHGTSRRHGKRIYKEGINLDRCERYADFGRAFYTARWRRIAFDWAKKQFGNRGAVLFYGVKEEWRKLAIKKLSDAEWAMVITQHQNGRTKPPEGQTCPMAKMDVIEGPICSNPHEVRQGLDPKQIPKPNTQVVLKTLNAVASVELRDDALLTSGGRHE